MFGHRVPRASSMLTARDDGFSWVLRRVTRGERVSPAAPVFARASFLPRHGRARPGHPRPPGAVTSTVARWERASWLAGPILGSSPRTAMTWHLPIPAFIPINPALVSGGGNGGRHRAPLAERRAGPAVTVPVTGASGAPVGPPARVPRQEPKRPPRDVGRDLCTQPDIALYKKAGEPASRSLMEFGTAL